MKMDEYLGLFYDYDRGQCRAAAVVYNRAGKIFIKKTFYIEGNMFVLQRFDRFGVDHLRAVIGHLDYFIIIEFTQETGILKRFWISIHNTFNILPDRKRGCIQH